MSSAGSQMIRNLKAISVFPVNAVFKRRKGNQSIAPNIVQHCLKKNTHHAPEKKFTLKRQF
jgi:hypothetical protein